LTIGNGVTSIGQWAFNGCNNIKNIYFDGTLEQWNTITKPTVLINTDIDYTIHCTDGDIAKDGTITYHNA
jgi:hypothetical protein